MRPYIQSLLSTFRKFCKYTCDITEDSNPDSSTKGESDANSGPATPSHFYRFRDVESLLGKRQELAKQEIYLASPRELNDPVEGYKDVFWLGDAVLWRNFFRHYMLSLTVAVLNETERLEEPTISAFLTLDDLQTDRIRNLVAEISNTFLAQPVVQSVLSELVLLRQPLGPATVTFFLTAVHTQAVELVFKTLVSNGLADAVPSPLGERDKPELHELLAMLRKADTKLTAIDLEQILHTSQRLQEQLKFISLYNARSKAGFAKVVYLLTEFPERYVAQLSESLIQPPWYTACFTEDCTNASMWGSYAYNHTGVALKFRAPLRPDGCPSILLEGVTGWSGVKGKPPVPMFGKIPFRLYKVSYGSEPPTVDFFRFLGRLPWPKYLGTWLIDDLGRRTERLNGDFDAKWRDQLWDLFYRGATRKLSDWKFEREYRIVDVDLDGTRSKEHQLVRYPFDALAGIVFGIRTRVEDKIRFAEIIEKKCRQSNRKDFKFFQAHYVRARHRIEISPMDLLKFVK